MRVTYAIIHVSEMGRSVAFYRDVLGLPLRFESPAWTEFATGGATLALHEGNGPGGEASLNLPAGHCRPGLSVPDLAAFHWRMVEHRVPCLQAPRDIFGDLVAQYADPDGLVIAVSEDRHGS